MSITSTSTTSKSTSTSPTRFLNYGKLLENSTQFPNNKKHDNTNTNNEWVVTEKVHGANFSFHVERNSNSNNNNNTDDNDNDSEKEGGGGLWVRVAKRRGFLSSDNDDNFFDHHVVVQNLRNTILKAAKQEFFDNDDNDDAQDNNNNNGKKNPTIRLVVFFGELFGGYYPNNGSDADDDDNKRTKSRKSDAVQQGIWYSPNKHFYLFDIAVMYEEKSGTTTSCFFIPYKRTVEIATKHKILYAKPLYIGPFNKAIHYNPKFITTIPNQLLLDHNNNNTNIIIKDNFAEGIVVKQWNSVDPIIMINEKNDTTSTNTNTSTTRQKQKQQQQQRRPIYKIKIKEFQELPSNPPPSNKKHINDYEYRKWIISLINSNRIAAAISKVGNPSIIENQNEIINLILQDLIDESGCDGDDDNLIMVEMKEQLECIAYDELRKYVYQCCTT